MKLKLGLTYLQLVGFLVAVSAQDALVATSDPVQVGEPLLIRCQSNQTIDGCRFQISGFGSDIKLFQGVRNPKYTFVGDYSKGDCSILVNSASPSNHGTARCQVSYPKSDRLDETKVDVRVLHPPDTLTLTSNSNFFYNEGDQMHFNCTAVGGYPPPTLTLRLDDKVLAQSNNSMALTHTRKANHSDHFKKVFCTADHSESPEQFIWTRDLAIKHAPKFVNYSVTGDDRNTSISVLVLAFPKPYLVQWSSPQGPLQAGTYQEWEEFTQHQDRGVYVYHLQDFSVTDETNEILLTVENELGKRELSIKLEQAPGNSWTVFLLMIVSVVMLLFAVSLLRNCFWLRVAYDEMGTNPNWAHTACTWL